MAKAGEQRTARPVMEIKDGNLGSVLDDGLPEFRLIGTSRHGNKAIFH